jgi:hypothetical protein
MNSAPIDISAPGVDVDHVMEDIRAAVARKRAEGFYSDPRIARAERMNLSNLTDEDSFTAFYLECLRDAVHVDINDFEIRERRRFAGPLLVAFKRTVWSLLKFYTYRLWSQQNQANGMLLTAVEEIDNRYREKIARLEERIARLESGTPPKS